MRLMKLCIVLGRKNYIKENLNNRIDYIKFKSKENYFVKGFFGLQRFSVENTILKTDFELVSFKKDYLLATSLVRINNNLQLSTGTCLFELRSPGYFTVIHVDQ